MKLHHPLALALSAALALAGGCKTDKPAPPAPAAGGEATTTPQPAGGTVQPPTPRPSLPAPSAEPPAAANDPAPADDPAAGDTDPRGRRAAVADKDGDGHVNEQEQAAALHERATAMRTRLDANGDGKLTPDELAAVRRMRFDDPAALDTNHDGDISADELAAGIKARRDQRRGNRGAPGTP